MRRQLVGTALCRTSEVSYYLLEETLEDRESYGVEIALEEEAAAIRDLCPSRERAWGLAEVLARSVVTPVALRDVVDDWLLE